MNREQILSYSQELLDSLNSLPMRDEPNYSREWNEGYRTAVLQVVRDLNNRVVIMDSQLVESK